MIPRVDPSPELLELATLQSGALTAEQAHAYGLGRRPVERLLAQGRWVRLDNGLYSTVPGPVGWLTVAWAGVLVGRDGARLGGHAAAHLWGLVDPPDQVEVLVPWPRSIQSRGVWIFRRERAGVHDASARGNPPRLTVEDTVLDLCQHMDAKAVVDLVTRAVQSRVTTAARLRRTVTGRRQLRHRKLLMDLLHDVAVGAETPLELHYLRDVEQAHGLPRGSRQHVSRRSRDVRDVVYEEFATVVELDGQIGHAGLGRFRDMRRDNAAVLAGECTLRYGWRDVLDRSCGVAWQVGSVLMTRGWSGSPSRCDRCRLANDHDLG